MRLLTFANRNTKEILRDPLTLFFGLGFPLVLILLLSAIQANIPVELFEIKHLTPGITVFGLAFMTLFSATIIAKDRGSSLLQRLYTTPLTPMDYILGYTLPIIPISVAQCVICYIAAIFLGLDITVNILYAIGLVVPVALNQATEVGTITTLPIGIALLFAVLPYLFGGWFTLLTWMASLLQNQIGGYLMVGCVYCVLAGWSRSIVDYRQWTLYETSLVSGLYEQAENHAEGL